MASIPITVFTGFIGAGKTTIILSLLSKLPKGYKAVLLKNEFGDIEVDSQLAKQSSLMAVSEILNGCLCCVLVGQMKTALLEIRDKFRPDRIFVECSGSAFPATLAFQIRELERETEYDIRLDAIVTVIDAENFTGYEDTSPTAKMQASYSDIILINKWEHVNDRALDLVIDHLNTLNDATPKIRCDGRDGVDPNLLFGIDSKLFTNGPADMVAKDHHDEVQTITVLRKASEPLPHGEVHNLEDCPRSGDLQKVDSSLDGMEESLLRSALERLFKEVVWRVKGFVRLRGRLYILNWAFGRYDLTEVHPPDMSDDNVRLTVMGERGEVKKAVREFCRELRAEVA